MSLNANYTFEDLGDVKCSIIEKNCSQERVDFLKRLLEFNGFEVVVVKSPPPKGAKLAVVENPEEVAVSVAPAAETFTVGVTDVTFNPINGVYNRQLKTEDGKFVTPFYWKQIDKESQDDIWYWKKRSQS